MSSDMWPWTNHGPLLQNLPMCNVPLILALTFYGRHYVVRPRSTYTGCETCSLVSHGGLVSQGGQVHPGPRKDCLRLWLSTESSWNWLGIVLSSGSVIRPLAYIPILLSEGWKSRSYRHWPLWHTTFQVHLLQIASRPRISSWSLGWVAHSLALSRLASRSYMLVDKPNPTKWMDIVIWSSPTHGHGKGLWLLLSSLLWSCGLCMCLHVSACVFVSPCMIEYMYVLYRY